MPPPWWGCGFNWHIINPEIQPTSPLDLAGVVVATFAAGLVKMEVLVFLGVALICLACVGARLPWGLDKVAASLPADDARELCF